MLNIKALQSRLNSLQPRLTTNAVPLSWTKSLAKSRISTIKTNKAVKAEEIVIQRCIRR
jgi:hypothetical protein